jgi:RNA polymerase sigma-70 factor (ECF subfamily)
MTDSDEKPDEYFVARVTSGDVDAYAVLMQRYEAKLHRYVTYLIHDQTSAYDAVQETFIKAYQNLRSFNPKHKFSSWIYRIAHNEAMNIIRKNRHTSDSDIDTLPDQSYESHTDEVIDSSILKERVHGCLDKLDWKYREVIQLVYFEHMKYEDVSDVLHIPKSTVGVWLSRAKSRLKKICEQKGVSQ